MNGHVITGHFACSWQAKMLCKNGPFSRSSHIFIIFLVTTGI
uniref:Uncharacterized protein n=1 Tax=Anguilla anguilla TaxID=7936 RepID=A0A0E9PUY9_ANGAN